MQFYFKKQINKPTSSACFDSNLKGPNKTLAFASQESKAWRTHLQQSLQPRGTEEVI